MTTANKMAIIVTSNTFQGATVNDVIIGVGIGVVLMALALIAIKIMDR